MLHSFCQISLSSLSIFRVKNSPRDATAETAAGAARFGHVPVIKSLLDSKAQLHQRLKGAGATAEPRGCGTAGDTAVRGP